LIISKDLELLAILNIYDPGMNNNSLSSILVEINPVLGKKKPPQTGSTLTTAPYTQSFALGMAH
jgi:hypothetical protein